MLKVVTIAAIFGFALGADVSLRFPQSSPCVMVDIDASFQMAWTDVNGNVQTKPDFPFASNAVFSGECLPAPTVTVRFDDSETFTFSFSKTDDTVNYDWRFRYSPQKVFNNSQPGVVTHTGTLGTGSATKSFACRSLPVVHDIKFTDGGNKYEVNITINSFQAQGFGISDGQYSPEERCPSDVASTPSGGETTEPTTEPTTAPSKPTTAPSKPTTEPSKPTTEPSKPTTEPSKPTTEPSKPTTETTPTTAPSTKPTAGNETTAPSTQTTAPSTAPTTPVPLPSGHAKQTFSVYNNNDVLCVRMAGEFLFTLAYTKEDNTTGTKDIGVQEIRSVAGNCNDTNENVVSVFFYDTWQMDLTISKKTESESDMLMADSSSDYYWSNLVLKYDYDTKLGGKSLFPDVMQNNKTEQMLNVTFASGTYQASTGGSYMCNSNEALDLQDNNKLQTWNLQYEAFTTSNSTGFPEKNLTECSADSKTSSVVPIAVGAALAGLVVIVLIAYLIGRRRNRKGYESV